MSDLADEKPTPELVKSMISVPELAELLDLEVNGQNKIRSPFNAADETPSCHLYEDHFYDYSTGQGGDVIDLLRAVCSDEENQMSYSEALWRLWRRALKAGREPGDVETGKPRVVEDMSPQVLEYIRANPPYVWPEWSVWLPGNVVSTVTEMIVPHQDGTGIYGVKVRKRNGGKLAWPGSQFMHRLYHPYAWRPAQHRQPDVCLITEGESDCWALTPLLEPHFPVYALPSGAGSWRDSWLKDLEPYSIILTAFDNDDAGKKATDKVASKVGVLRHVRVPIPQLAKDVRDALEMGWPAAPEILKLVDETRSRIGNVSSTT